MPYLCPACGEQPARGEQWEAGDTECPPEHRAHNWGTKSAPRRLQAVFAQLAQESHECSLPETAASNPTLSKQGLTTTPSVGKADAGLFLEPPAFILCLNSP